MGKNSRAIAANIPTSDYGDEPSTVDVVKPVKSAKIEKVTESVVAEFSSMQQKYFSGLVENKNKVNIYLTNGVRLQGTIQDFDNFSLLLTHKDSLTRPMQLVYKHAISTVSIDNGMSYDKPNLHNK